MYNEHTLDAVAPLAQFLTETNRVCDSAHEGYPLHTVMQCYETGAVPNNEPVSVEMFKASQEAFEEVNQNPPEVSEDTFVSQAKLMAKGLAAIAYKARNVAIPVVTAVVKQLHEATARLQNTDISIDAYNYSPLHGDVKFLTHVNQNYGNLEKQASYRSFVLEPKLAENIIELVANNNPHFSSEVVVNWALDKLTPENIVNVWRSLFTQRTFSAANVNFTQVGNLPFCIDELLLAYFITGHLKDNPEDVTGESVSLEQWQSTLAQLHALLGAHLLTAYHLRASDVKSGKLVLRSTGFRPLETFSVKVVTNGDLFVEWLEKGGDGQVLLANAVYNPGATTIAAIDASEGAVQRWTLLHQQIQRAAEINAIRKGRETLLAILSTPNQELDLGLPQLPEKVFHERINEALSAVTDDYMSDPYNTVAKVVCAVYYKGEYIYDFLKAYEVAAKRGLTNGSAIALDAMIEIAACWLYGQIKVGGFNVTDPTHVEQQLEASQVDDSTYEPDEPEAEDAVGDYLDNAEGADESEAA